MKDHIKHRNNLNFLLNQRKIRVEFLMKKNNVMEENTFKVLTREKENDDDILKNIKYRSIKKYSINFLISILITVGMIIMGKIYMDTVNETLCMGLHQHLLEVSKQGINQMKQINEEYFRVLRIMAGSLADMEAVTTDDLNRITLDVVKNDFLYVGYADADSGIAKTSNGYTFYAGDRSYVADVLQGQEQISAILQDRTEIGREIIVFSAPVYEYGRIKGVVFAALSKEAYGDRITMDFYSGQGYSFVVDNDGQFIFKNQEKEFPANIFDSYRGEQSEKIRKDIRGNQPGILQIDTIDGKKMVAYSSIDTMHLWNFFSVLPETAIKSQMDLSRQHVWSIVAVLLMLFWCITGYNIWSKCKKDRLIFALGYSEAQTVFENQRLVKSLDVARQLEETQTNFVSNMSHEIRTPINAIMGMNEMILRECQDTKIRGYALNVKHVSGILLSLVNEVLDFSKIKAGKMELCLAEYDFSELLKSIITVVQGKIDQKELAFMVHVKKGIPKRFLGDQGRVSQILINILNNAVKYTPRGEIHLYVSCADAKEANLKTVEKLAGNKYIIKFQISDTGVGIKEEDLAKLFNEFIRLDIEKNRNVEGTGLGLAIVQKLLNLMGGRIEAASVYNQGSTFTVYLPQQATSDEKTGDIERQYVNDCQAMPKAYEYKPSFTAPEAKVLVVDDNQINRELIQVLLKETQVQVFTVENGKSCLSFLEKMNVDIILMDHMMPEMDGVETLHELHDRNLCKDTPIIALTANAMTGARERYIKEGFDDYISKPVEGDYLEKMLYRYLSSTSKVNIIKQTEIDRRKNIPSASFVQGKDEVYIDVALGLRFCGNNISLYEKIQEDFVAEKEEQFEKISQAMQLGEWKSYVIGVHGLKSAALIIGAEQLSKEAKLLEEAGKKGDIEYIKANHTNVMDLYDKVVFVCKKEINYRRDEYEH